MGQVWGRCGVSMGQPWGGCGAGVGVGLVGAVVASFWFRGGRGWRRGRGVGSDVTGGGAGDTRVTVRCGIGV